MWKTDYVWEEPAYNQREMIWRFAGGNVQKVYLWALLVLGGGTISQPAVAQSQGDPIGLSLDGAVEARAVANAGLQSESADQVSEVQTTTSFDVKGRLQGGWAEFLTNYRAEDRRFSEFKEDDELLILGDSALTLGPQRRQYYFQLSHSSREVSLDPLAADRPGNRDNRVFFTGLLYGSITPGRGNSLGMWASATDIQFDASVLNEARRYSAGALFEREVSALSRIGVSVSGYELEYRNVEGNDVQYSRVAASWRTELRRLSYGAEIGNNRIETEVHSVSSPSVVGDLSYVAGPQSVRMSYNQFLSDTSQGAQTSTDVMSITDIEVNGRLSGVIDQYKLQRFSFAWRHAQLCISCTFELTLGMDQELYMSFQELDSRELYSRMQFRYRVSSAVIMSLQADYRDLEETNVEPSRGYTQTALGFSVGFPRLIRNGQLDLLLGGLKRNSEIDDDYESTYVGLRFRYRFYES